MKAQVIAPDLLERVTLALRAVAFAETPAGQEAARKLAADVLAEIETECSPVGTLTHRQREVFYLIKEGLDNPDIADRLGMSVKTVSVHLNGIKAKFGMRSTRAVVVAALKHDAASLKGGAQ